jgi:TonB family protein
VRLFVDILLAVIAVAMPRPIQAQFPAWAGTWSLEPTQSIYRAGQASKWLSISISSDAGINRTLINLTDATGHPLQTETISRFDGIDVVVIGPRVPLTRAFTAVGDYTLDIVEKIDGRVTVRTRAVVSVDGRTLTVEQRGIDEGGHPVDNTQVFIHSTGAGTGLGPGGLQPPLPPGVYWPGRGVSTPRVVREVKPNYTADALRLQVQGNVLLQCVVKTDGTVGDVTVLRSLDRQWGLDDEAIKVAKQWRFEPGTRNGEAVAVMITIELVFKIGKD